MTHLHFCRRARRLGRDRPLGECVVSNQDLGGDAHWDPDTKRQAEYDLNLAGRSAER